MNCDQLPDFLADPGFRAELEAHLAGCPACREDAALWARLGALPVEQPSVELRARFEAMLYAYRAGTEQAERAARRRFSLARWIESWWPYHPVLQFSIAAACLVVGLIGGLLAASRGASNQELARLRDEVHHTRQMVALSLLEQQSASDRLRGVNWSSRIQRPGAEVLTALLETARRDPSVDVRLAAIDALRPYAALAPVRQGLLEALRAPQSPLVQIALIDLMVELRDRDSLGALRQLRSDKAANPAVRQRADWGIQQF